MQILNLVTPDDEIINETSSEPNEKEKSSSGKCESVFFCGSREIGSISKISDIPVALSELLDCVHNYRKILVGDCTGIDELVQRYLLEIGYKNVEVYTSGDVRVYLDTDWRLIECQADRNIKDNLPLNEYVRAFYAVKDKIMCQNCDKMVAIWNGYSRATRKNIDRMISLNKSYHIIEF